jgi:plastocyanin
MVFDEGCTRTAGTDTTCDGTDEDCDGVADDDYVQTPTACGVGACLAAGELTCQGGREVDTCTPGTPAADDITCDGVDDDCNGIDDDHGEVDCDDGLVCTVEGGCLAGVCDRTVVDCSALGDGCAVGVCEEPGGSCVRAEPPAGNLCPFVTSTPATSFLLGVPYAYDDDGLVEATGAEPMTFSLVEGPDGMTVSPHGEVSWVPTTSGAHDVSIQVENSGGSALHDFTVTRPLAETPAFVRDAGTQASTGVPYRYNLEKRVGLTGVVPGERFTVRVVDGPAGFVVGGELHEVGWVPAEVGSFAVTLVLESAGASVAWDLYAFTIHVTDAGTGSGASITAVAVVTPSEGLAPLTVQLDASGSTGTDGSHIVLYHWDLGTPGGDVILTHEPVVSFTYPAPQGATVRLLVRDQLGHAAQSTVLVAVSADDNAPPSALIDATPISGPAPLTVALSCQ